MYRGPDCGRDVERDGRDRAVDPSRPEDTMNVERSRIKLLLGAVALGVTLTAGLAPGAWAEPLAEITVYKSPT